MLTATGITIRFGKRTLFEDVNIKFNKGCCYGIIGANGAGKSTFLKVLSGEIEPSKGEVSKEKNERLSVLKQDHFAFEEYTVMDTVIMGNQELYSIMKEKEEIYAKPDFSEEDGMKAAKLEERFAELDGWNAEADGAVLLNDLGIEPDKHYKLMKEIEPKDKVKVLLAQALFGNPDILLLDEPTNDLDLKSINWLEEFLINFENTVIVVSHDRYFLNKVCTHIADVDFGKIKVYPGNYDFWYESSQLALKQMKEANKKKEEKIKELQEFIARFSANASKSKQATSRKKSLEKIELDEIKPSNRRYPYVDFKPDREPGKEILTVKNITKTINGEKILDNISFTVKPNDKIAFLADNENAKTVLFQILAGELEPDSGEINYGTTITTNYFPKDNNYLFDSDLTITEWLRGYSKDPDETYVRSFLGRMLFSGEEALKKVNVLSGGEKVRCVLSKMMLSGANLLIFDEPTNHLDMESITALNEGMKKYKGIILFTSHDHQLTQTVANRILDIKKDGLVIEINRHKLQIEKIQQIVNDMLNEGFNFSSDELKDLRGDCNSLHKQAVDMARKDASRIKVLFFRNKDYEEAVKHLQCVINNNAGKLYTVLRSGALHPLDIDAYEVKEGTVTISSAWLSRKEEEFTIRPTPERIKAHELVQKLKKAIDELNDFVSGNPYFGKGFSYINDERRCLCRLTEEGEFYVEDENFEYI